MSDSSEQPTTCASRTLMPSEKNYSQVEKEALSLFFGVSKFHTYLYRRHFTLETDHKPLATILGRKSVSQRLHLQCWAVKLAAYSHDIRFCCTTTTLMRMVYRISHLLTFNLLVIHQTLPCLIYRNSTVSLSLQMNWLQQLAQIMF